MAIEFDWFPGADDDEREQAPRPHQPPDPDFDYTREDDPEAPEAIHPEEYALEFPRAESPITLRGYQNEGAEKTFEAWDRGESRTVVVLPTGAGKTYLGGAVIDRYGPRYGLRHDGRRPRALVLVHRGYLAKQWAKSLTALGIDCAIEKGQHKARGGFWGDPEVVVAMVQSMQCKGGSRRLLGWPRDYFDLIIPDECHRATSPMYRSVLNYFRPRHVLGLTATPDRMDGDDLGTVFDSIAYEYFLDEALGSGWVCPIKIRWCDVKVDLRALKVKGDDFNDKDIADAISPHVEKFARAIVREVGDRKTIIYCPTVRIAGAMAKALGPDGMGKRAESLDGSDDEAIRETILGAFRGGEYQYLCNCELFTEGFDCPDVEAIVLLRPTQSRELYYQMVGRGLRPKGGGNLVVVDFPWVAGKHKLIKPAQLLSPRRFEQEQFDMAEALLDVGEVDDLMDAMSKADDLIRERNRKLPVRVKDGAIRYRRVEYDPLSHVEVKELPPRQEVEAHFYPATPAQVRMLEENGFLGAERMSRKQASGIISKIKKRREVIGRLIEHGYERRAAWRLTGPQAARELKAILIRAKSA